MCRSGSRFYVREGASAFFCMREPVSRAEGGGDTEREEFDPSFPWTWASRGPVLSHVRLSVQIRTTSTGKGLQSGQTAGYSDNVIG